ncbi:MAG: hypothetical protein AAGK01_05860, partial [Pseudomonadota bacterium]
EAFDPDRCPRLNHPPHRGLDHAHDLLMARLATVYQRRFDRQVRRNNDHFMRLAEIACWEFGCEEFRLAYRVRRWEEKKNMWQQ